MKTLHWCRLTALTLPAVLLSACSGGAAAPPPPVTAMVEIVGQGQGERGFAGEVRARQESALSFQVPGRLMKRHVDAGQHVAAGQLLAELDASDYALQADAAQAQVAAAEAEYTRAAEDLSRYRRLAEEQLVSQSALAGQQTAYNAAKAQLDAARAQLSVSRNQAGYARLLAPAAGVIASRQAEAGQVIAAGQPVFQLAADSGREVAIALPETAIDDFQVGQPAQVELWNAPGKRLPGTVREIAASADPQARTYAARVTVDAGADALSLGQSARVFFAAAGNSLSIPLGAVHGEPGKPDGKVWVVDPATGVLSPQAVEIARWGQQRAEVRSGIASGQWVVAAGGHLLREGQQVRAVDRDNRLLSAPVAAESGE